MLQGVFFFFFQAFLTAVRHLEVVRGENDEVESGAARTEIILTMIGERMRREPLTAQPQQILIMIERRGKGANPGLQCSPHQ